MGSRAKLEPAAGLGLRGLPLADAAEAAVHRRRRTRLHFLVADRACAVVLLTMERTHGMLGTLSSGRLSERTLAGRRRPLVRLEILVWRRRKRPAGPTDQRQSRLRRI